MRFTSVVFSLGRYIRRWSSVTLLPEPDLEHDARVRIGQRLDFLNIILREMVRADQRSTVF
jgi:hypothetical protein